ncbi:hypothetical protein JVT61DRAFT_11938 [Boletus reticuloceps]|uniref:Uncharacterized protein n=1 Tax=Boletus reticuloceps TaxID=495285 RepID=A0A8I3ADH4_9AGAM|nr:hypothetical protein JVT61DRAFT_11938 [Boletus reticuloceps]
MDQFTGQHMAQQTDIDLLENFRQAVWGNPAALAAQTAGQDGQPVLYIDLDHHLAALQVIFMEVRREEILVLREYQEAITEFRRNTGSYRNGACISGQARSGKSTFLAYALIERLREQQPVAVQPSWSDEHGEYILFTQNGTSVHKWYDQTPIANHGSNLWLLCDTKENFQGPTLAFARAKLKKTGPRIFIAASQANMGRKWAFRESIVVYYMDLWSLQDIRDLGSIFKYEPNIINSMTELAIQYGSMPGVVTTILQDPGLEDFHRGVVMEDVGKTLSDPTTVIKALLQVDNPPTGPSTVFFIRPYRDGDGIKRTMHEVLIPTPWLADQLVISLNDNQKIEKANFVELLASDKRTRSAAGWVYEATVHELLDQTTSITVRWYDGPPQTISFPRPLETRSTDPDLNSAPPFYWRPPRSNQAGIDGAIFAEDHVYLIQATISRNHPSPQNGIWKFWNDVPEDKRRLPWKLIFIGPSDDQINQASAKYSRSLQYGAARTRSALEQDVVTKTDLPVGRFSFRPINIPSVFEF